MAHDVFISHSVKDKPTADAVCAFLEADGLRCWIAPRDIAPGTTWAGALIDAIQATRVLLLIVSSRSNESKQVFREVSAASEAGIPVLPLRIEPTVPAKGLGFFIGPEHWLDAITPPFASHLPALREAVRRLLEGAPKANATPTTPTPRPPPRGGAVGRMLASRRGRVVAACAVLALAIAGGTVAWLRRGAMLTIESEPADAVATVDGVPVGATPLALPVASGSHGVVLRRPGFRDWSKVVDLAAGEKASYSLQLVVVDPRDAGSVNLVAKSLGVTLPRYGLPLAERGVGDGAALELVVPRGAVRPSDLTMLVMDADPRRVEPSGVVALRRGDTTLFEARFNPEAAEYVVSLPDTVRAGLRAGDALVWGRWPKAGAPVTATLTVVADDVAPLLADVDRRLAAQPASIRAQVRAQALLDRRFFTGAFLEARALAMEDVGDLRAGAVMEQALARSDGGELRVAVRLRDALRTAPAAERAKVFDEPPAPAR